MHRELLRIGLVGALVAFGLGCYMPDARVTGSGEYEASGDDAPQQAARGKSKMKGWGSACTDTDQCDAYALNCARQICTFTCTTDHDCDKVAGRCAPRYEHAHFESEKVCIPK